MTEIIEQLKLNQTFFIQFILFVSFFLVLKNLYLSPFQKLIEKRNHKLKDEAQGALELLKTVEAKLAEYEKSLHALRLEARSGYENVISQARAKEDAAIAANRDSLKKEYQSISQQLIAEKTKIETELKSQATALADGIVEKLLLGKK